MSKLLLLLLFSLILNILNASENDNNNCISFKPVGLHFDIEPHGLTQRWRNEREEIATEFLSLVKKIKNECMGLPEAQGLELVWDLQMHQDDPQHISIEDEGVKKSLSEHVIPYLDRATIMSYRDFSLGPDSITASSQREMEIGRSSNTNIVLAVETNDQGLDKVDFEEEGVKIMDKELTKVEDYFKDFENFKGTAIHDYRGFKSLLDTKIRKKKIGRNKRGLFVWDYKIFEDDAKLETFTSFLKQQQIKSVYIESESLIVHEKKNEFIKFMNKMNNLGVAIDLLFGWHEWASEANHNGAIGLCKKAVHFIDSIQLCPVDECKLIKQKKKCKKKLGCKYKEKKCVNSTPSINPNPNFDCSTLNKKKKKCKKMEGCNFENKSKKCISL